MNAREDAVWVADTITQLRAEIERLRAALRKIEEFWNEEADDDAHTLACIAREALNEQVTTEPKP
jgi:hypothetical protein